AGPFFLTLLASACGLLTPARQPITHPLHNTSSVPPHPRPCAGVNCPFQAVEKGRPRLRCLSPAMQVSYARKQDVAPVYDRVIFRPAKETTMPLPRAVNIHVYIFSSVYLRR